jgi:hypothetical protein
VRSGFLVSWYFVVPQTMRTGQLPRKMSGGEPAPPVGLADHHPALKPREQHTMPESRIRRNSELSLRGWTCC